MKWAGERLVGRVRGSDKGQGLVGGYGMLIGNSIVPI